MLLTKGLYLYGYVKYFIQKIISLSLQTPPGDHPAGANGPWKHGGGASATADLAASFKSDLNDPACEEFVYKLVSRSPTTCCVSNFAGRFLCDYDLVCSFAFFSLHFHCSVAFFSLLANDSLEAFAGRGRLVGHDFGGKSKGGKA